MYTNLLYQSFVAGLKPTVIARHRDRPATGHVHHVDTRCHHRAHMLGRGGQQREPRPRSLSTRAHSLCLILARSLARSRVEQVAVVAVHLSHARMPTTSHHHPIHLAHSSALMCSMMSTGPIFREVAGKFDLWRSRRWRSGFKSDTIRTLQPLHHCSVGYQPSTT